MYCELKKFRVRVKDLDGFEHPVTWFNLQLKKVKGQHQRNTRIPCSYKLVHLEAKKSGLTHKELKDSRCITAGRILRQNIKRFLQRIKRFKIYCSSGKDGGTDLLPLEQGIKRFSYVRKQERGVCLFYYSGIWLK